MKKMLFCFGLSSLVLSPLANATLAFDGVNYSGEYLCKGTNESVGDYAVTVSLKLNKLSSQGKLGVYDFNTETVNAVTYFGQAVADGNRIALTFKLSKAPNAEYSTGIGEFKKLSGRRWGFHHRYYEPDDTGGNYGTEFCTMQKTYITPPATSLKNTKPNAKKTVLKTK
ncbi:MAG: hypothetical protein WBP13_03965 [Methylophilaceae bacterium]